MKQSKLKHIFVFAVLICFTFLGIREVKAEQAEPASAWVVSSVYKNGSILFDGATSATMTVKVPYFDLTSYDLADYVLKDEEDNTLEKPTLLHGIIYLLEKYCLQSEEVDLGTGKHKDAIFSVNQENVMKYYNAEGTIETTSQTGGTLLSLDDSGKMTSLWGFGDQEIRIYLNQKQKKKAIHEVLLEDINSIEFMLISEDNKRTILYPRLFQDTLQVKVGETVESTLYYYDLNNNAYEHNGTSLYQVSHLDKLESFDVNINGDSASGTVTLGPFQYPGIYKAKIILYPFYYKQLIEVVDTKDQEDATENEGPTTEAPPSTEEESPAEDVPSTDVNPPNENIPSTDVNPPSENIPSTNVNPPTEETPHEEENLSTELVPPVSEGNSATDDKDVQDKKIKKGDKFTVSGAIYKITKASKKNGTVEYVKRKKSAKTVTISATVKYKGITYKVTSIGAKAFYNNKKLTKVAIGKNVIKIGKNAFAKCKKLKTITIKTTRLKKGTVGSKAFSGIHAKAVVKVPENKVKTYKSLLQGRGAKKTIKVKK